MELISHPADTSLQQPERTKTALFLNSLGSDQVFIGAVSQCNFLNTTFMLVHFSVHNTIRENMFLSEWRVKKKGESL